MSEFDYLILFVIGIGACIGLWRGFFHEVVSTIGLLLAVIAANFASPYVRPYITWFENETISAIIVWLIIMVLAMALLKLLAHLLDELMSSIALGGINRLAGAVVGAIKYCLLATLLISGMEVFCAHFPTPRFQAWLADSIFVPYLHFIFDIVSPWASQHILAPALELIK